jgi:stress response protein YsnF
MQRANLVDIDERAARWRQEGWDRHQAEAAPYTAAEARQERERYGQQLDDEGKWRIPVVEEEISVGTREVERGRVRIHSRVEERPVEESVQLREEHARVERHPVDRPATEADLAASRNETIEVTETAEEPVVRKRARVVEEVSVHKDVEEHTETVRDTVRRTEVDVEQVGAQAGTESRGFEAYMPVFRQHHTSTFADRGGAYKDYEPAYRYGYGLAMNSKYHGRDWKGLETDARRDWEARHTGTWDKYRDAIYYGWDKGRVRPQG